MKYKVCYILPEYREDSSTHFSYITRLLSEASKELDIFLIIEKGSLPRETFGCSYVKLVGSSFFLLRAIKLKFWVVYARYCGYRDFYVHYSFLAALTAAVAVRLYKGRVFYWNCGEPWKYKRSFIRDSFERLVYRMVTFVVTGTQKLAQEYAENYHIPVEKIKVMPNWIDMERFKEMSDKNTIRKELGLPNDKKIVFFVHHLSLRKGSRMILPVVSALLQIRNDVFFVVAGSGPDEAKLRSRAESPALKNFVQFRGAVPNRDIQKYFSVADVFFMPSQEEGFPRVILESMASGIPVIASDVGSVLEIVPTSMKPFVLSPNDTLGFVRMLNKILSQKPEEIQKQQKELRARAEEFTTQIVAKKFIQLFI